MMDRNNLDLLYSVLNFLKKLSIFSENERQMVQYKVVDKLNKFIPNPNQQLVNIILRLTLNLSFDVEFCDQLAETPLLKKIVEMLKIGQMRSHGISILYQLSKWKNPRRINIHGVSTDSVAIVSKIPRTPYSSWISSTSSKSHIKQKELWSHCK